MKKVVWISSYLPRAGGIAFYSSDYISALKKIKKINFKIIALKGDNKADYPVIDTKDKNWHKKVFKIIKKEKPDIVHFQHEYGLYETYEDRNQRVVDLLGKLKDEKIPTVMTYHSVYERLEDYQKNFISSSLKKLDAGIVHEQYQKDALPKNLGWKPENVYVLPHGSKEDVDINRKRVRKWFGYDSELVVGTAGLADKRKGFITLIKQWPKVVKKFPNSTLSLELKPHFNIETRKYIDEVLEEVMKSSVSDNIEFIVKDYSVEEFYKRLTCFDVLVLPYKSESQSGVLAHGFAAGTPAVVTDIEGLGAEIRNSKAGIAVKKRKKFYKAINKLLASKSKREKFRKNAKKYVKKVSGWSIIAKKTFKIYDKFW